MLNFQAVSCPTVSNKMHLLFKHKKKYEPYLVVFSDEHGERHKEIQVVEKLFGHCLNKEILAECIWFLKRDTNFYKCSKTVF